MDSTATISATPGGSLSPLEALPPEIHRMIFGLFYNLPSPAVTEDMDLEDGIDDLIRLANTSMTLRRVALFFLLRQPYRHFSRAVQIQILDQMPELGMHVKFQATPFDFEIKPSKTRLDALNRIASGQITRFGVNLTDEQSDMNKLLLHYSLENELALSFGTGLKILRLTSNGPLDDQFQPIYVNDEEPKHLQLETVSPKGGQLLSLANQGKPGTLFPHLGEIYCDFHTMGDSDPPPPGLEILHQIIRGTPILETFTYATKFRTCVGRVVSPNAIIEILSPCGTTLRSLTLIWPQAPDPYRTLAEGPGLHQFSKLERLVLCDMTFCSRIVQGPRHNGSCLTRILPKTVKILHLHFCLRAPETSDVHGLAAEVKKGHFPALETLECTMEKITRGEIMESTFLRLPDDWAPACQIRRAIRDAFAGTGVKVMVCMRG